MDSLSVPVCLPGKLEGNDRDSWMDNVKAVLILLVVVGHFCGGVTGRQNEYFSMIYDYIYLFHMPVFLMISGRFSKKRIDQHKIGDVFHKIFLPYLMLTVCMSFLRISLGLELAYDSILSPYFGLWYLLAIGIYQLITIPGLVNRKWYPVLVAAVTLANGMLANELYGKFTKIVYFYPFFLLGYYSNQWDLRKLMTKTARIVGWGYFAALVPVAWLCRHFFTKHLLVLDRVFADMTGYGAGVSVVVFVVRMLLGFGAFFALLAVCPSGKLSITSLGRYSLYIYGAHLFVVYAMRELLEQNHLLYLLQDGLFPMVYLASAVVLCFLVSSKPMRSWESYVLEPWQKLVRY